MRSSLSHSIFLMLPGATSMFCDWQTWFYWVGRSQTLPMSSDALWHIAWGNVGCQRVKYLLVLVEMIKYLLVFVEMIKLQSYTCCLFIVASKAPTEHFLELLVVGGSAGLDFSCWLLWLKFRTITNSSWVTLVLHYCHGMWSLTYICEGLLVSLCLSVYLKFSPFNTHLWLELFD